MQPITTEELREYAPGARDDYVQALVQGWPRSFRARRAEALGFVAETDFHDIIRTYIEEDLKR